MSYLMFPLVTRAYVIVDRIESDYAIVEWENEALTAINTRFLPEKISEGSLLRIHLYPSPYGQAYAKYGQSGILEIQEEHLVIPLEDTILDGLYYHFFFELIPWRPEP